MVVIRLARGGSKKKPFYHVVAADKRSPRDGRYIEQLGYFNPTAQGNAVRLELKQDRVDHWLSTGAQPSDRVNTLIKEFSKGMTAAIARDKAEHKQPAKKADATAEKPAAEADSEDSK